VAGDRAEQLGQLAQDGKVAQPVAAVGQQHRQPQHRARSMAVPAGLGATRPPAQGGGQPEPVGQLHQQRRPGMPGDPLAIAGAVKPRRRLGSLQPQVTLLGQRM
jgi:hypothetical protein